jgi:SAM-dependent methyltransferase
MNNEEELPKQLFRYDGALYPDYLRHGNAMQFAIPFAKHFCVGKGLDVGASRWPLEGAVPVDNGEPRGEWGALNLPDEQEGYGWDYIFSSHCLEHLVNPIQAIEYWKSKLRTRGVLFLYLPHPDMSYWRPQHCRKHLHSWQPKDMASILSTLGFDNVINSERDLAWSFCCVGYK